MGFYLQIVNHILQYKKTIKNKISNVGNENTL